MSKHKKSLSLDASEAFAPETEPEDSKKKEGVEFEVNLLWFIIKEASVNVHVFVSRTKDILSVGKLSEVRWWHMWFSSA